MMETKKKSKARQVLSSNLSIALVSICIASVIWMISKLEEVTVETISSQIFLENKPENCDVEVKPGRIDISVQYMKGFKDKVTSQNIKVFLDLHGDDSMAGVSDFQVTPRFITLQNVTVTEASNYVRPVEIVGDGLVNIRAKKYTEWARIKPDVRGEPAREFDVVETTIEPTQVRLTASPKVLEGLKGDDGEEIEVITEPIDLSGKKEDYYKTTSLILPEGVSLAESEGAQVHVNVQIAEKMAEKVMKGIEVDYRPFETRLAARCTPSTVTLTIRAPYSILNELTEDKVVVKPLQYLGGEKPGLSGEVVIEAQCADIVPDAQCSRIVFMGIDPPSVDVEIYERETSSNSP